jgi:alanine racemase
VRPTVALIDRSCLRANFRVVRDCSIHGNVMAVVKANAYGHGAPECAAVFHTEGAAMLGVAIADEAAALRLDKRLQGASVHVLTPPFADEADEYCRLSISFSAASLETVRAFDAAAKRNHCLLSAHLYLDTGMRRDGIEAHEAVAFMQACASYTNIRFDGLCTHFATSEESDTTFVNEQLRRFHTAHRALQEAGFMFQWTHAANSGAVLHLPEAMFNLVRSGIALYGYNPASTTSHATARCIHGLQPALTLQTNVVSVRHVPSGTPVSYGRTYITQRETTIATLPIGYGDGLSRALSNNAECLIRGRRFPIVGRICMDQCMVDVGEETIGIGDEAVIIGSQGIERLSADELAERIETIHYEVLTGISARVRRDYMGESAA